MANKRFNDLPEATSATVGDVLAIDGTTTRKITVENILDDNLVAIKGLTSAADKGIQFTGAGTAATYDLTAAGKALLDDADAAAQRATLGLGSAAVADTIDFATAAEAVPPGGTTGQVLAKASNADGDTTWVSGGGGGALLAANNLSDVADAATAFANLGGMDLSTVVNLTAASTLTSAAFGKLHFITGTSANYTTTLPTPVSNAGKTIALLVGDPTSSTKLYTIATPAGNIGRSGASIVMWANESVLLRSNGADWEVLQSKQIPFVGRLTKNTNQSITSGATFQNVTFTGASQDPSGLNLAFASNLFTAPRTGVYNFTYYVYLTQTGGTFAQSIPSFNADTVANLGTLAQATMINFGQGAIAAGATATVKVRADGTSPTVAGATIPSSLNFTEVVPSW